MTTTDEPLFRTAAEAVRFAVTREGLPPRPVMARMIASRMIDTVSGRRDLVGLDAAAQAGMVLNVIEGLGRLTVAALIASCAPRIIPCACRRPCCCGRKVNHTWREAIDTLAQEAIRALPSGSRRSYALRSGILLKIYAGQTTFKEIAEDLSLDQETVSRQHRAIYRWLKGTRAGRNGEPALEGLETAAWSDAETALGQAGLVG